VFGSGPKGSRFNSCQAHHPALCNRRTATPNPTRAGHTQIGFATDDIETEVNELRSRGVEFEEYDFPGLKTKNGIAQTGQARAAWFKDSEGNMIGILQLPPGAEPGT
jgi:hypothetical protein